MARDFPDRRDRLFGREGDVADLLQRARFEGLTVVVARPQMGKSWLLTELARRLAQEHEPPHLVGFAESAGQTPDLLLRAVIDLYSRWLADAGYRQQAEMVWEQQKSNVLPGVAKAVATMIKEAGQIAKPITGIVEDAINGLIATNQTLTTGGIQLPTLQYDQARDLVALTHRISSSPVVLVLDQWEQSPDPKFEARTLHAFLHHPDEWPPCHVFLAFRPEEPASGEVQSLERSLPGTAAIYPLGEMDLDTNESGRMLAHVRGTVPAAQDQADSDLLELVGGFPGVLYQWTGDYQRAHMKSLDDLRQVADDAHNYRFSDLGELLPGLDGDQRKLAIRLALLPHTAGRVFRSVKKEILDDVEEELIDDLALARVLESREPPGFGHAKRWEAAQAWFVEHRRAATRTEAEALILRLAAAVRTADSEFLSNHLALWDLRSSCGDVDVSNVCVALCGFVEPIEDEILIAGARQARATQFAAIAPYLALIVLRTLFEAQDDVVRRDVLLEELQALAGAHPEDAAVREQLTTGLFSMLIDATEKGDFERHDALLEALRGLANAHPNDAAVRDKLAMGLLSTLIEGTEKDAFERHDVLLEELRALAGADPGDTAVRHRLALGLIHTLNERRGVLLDALRPVIGAQSESAIVRELARVSEKMMLDAAGERRRQRLAVLQQKLSELAEAHPDDDWIELARSARLIQVGPALRGPS